MCVYAEDVLRFSRIAVRAMKPKDGGIDLVDGRRVIALCAANISNEDVHSIVFPLYRQLSSQGYKILIFGTGTDLYRGSDSDLGEAAVFRLIMGRIIDAVVIMSQTIKNDKLLEDIEELARSRSLPVFSIGKENSAVRHEGTYSIDFNEGSAFRSVVAHLVEHHGYKKLGCIAGFKGNPVSEERVRIFKDVLREHDLPFYENYFGYGDFYSVPTVNVMNKFFDDPDGLPEAIVCINDSMAITVCEMLAERGVRVPEDVAVSGFDGIIQERYTFPRITTCRRDMDKFADFMTETVNSYFAGEQMHDSYIFDYTPDFSESCGCRPLSTANVNKAVNTVYSRMSNIAQHECSMNNMLSKLTSERSYNAVNGILKYYIQHNTYICINVDFLDAEAFERNYENVPFSEEMLFGKFFYGDDDTESGLLESADILPEYDHFLKTDHAVLIMSVHNQKKVYGYTVSFIHDKDYNDFGLSLDRIQRFIVTLDTCIGMYVQQNRMFEYNFRLQAIQNKIIVSFADLVESRDNFTGQHIKRTGKYLRMLVSEMSSREKYKRYLTDEVQDMLAMAAPLHDIGKIKISDTILNKPGKLTGEEFEIIKTHTNEGIDIISKTLTDIENSEYLEIAGDMALYHHEKWDGSGYPYGLEGEMIPLPARIMAVVDVFDALTSRRVYKDAFSADKAFEILTESMGKHFDPDIAEIFISIREKIENVLNEYNE